MGSVRSPSWVELVSIGQDLRVRLLTSLKSGDTVMKESGELFNYTLLYSIQIYIKEEVYYSKLQKLINSN